MTHINNRPSYYSARVQDAEGVMLSLGIDLEQFYFGNIIKYLYRYPFKGEPLKDLIKARTYIDLLIEHRYNDDQKQQERSDNNAPWRGSGADKERGSDIS